MNQLFTNPRNGEQVTAISETEVQTFRQLGWLEELLKSDYKYDDSDMPQFSSTCDSTGEYEPTDYYWELDCYVHDFFQQAFVDHFFQWHSRKMRMHLLTYARKHNWKTLASQLEPYVFNLRLPRGPIYI